MVRSTIYCPQTYHTLLLRKSTRFSGIKSKGNLKKSKGSSETLSLAEMYVSHYFSLSAITQSKSSGFWGRDSTPLSLALRIWAFMCWPVRGLYQVRV